MTNQDLLKKTAELLRVLSHHFKWCTINGNTGNKPHTGQLRRSPVLFAACSNSPNMSDLSRSFLPNMRSTCWLKENRHCIHRRWLIFFFLLLKSHKYFTFLAVDVFYRNNLYVAVWLAVAHAITEKNCIMIINMKRFRLEHTCTQSAQNTILYCDFNIQN